MKAVFINDCAVDNCYEKNLGNGKQMCEEHEKMYQEGNPLKAFYGKTVMKKDNIKYNGYLISQDMTGYAPKESLFAFFLDDGERYMGSGESIDDCKKQIDFIISEQL